MTDPAQKLQQASKLCARNPPCVRTADTCITYCENARILRREKARPANGVVAAAMCDCDLQVFLNVYNLSPVNKHLRRIGMAIYHSAVESVAASRM